MREEDFIEMIRIQQEWDFKFRGRTFRLSYEKENGKDIILFGEEFLQKKYHSFVELLNDAYIDNSYFREVLADL